MKSVNATIGHVSRCPEHDDSRDVIGDGRRLAILTTRIARPIDSRTEQMLAFWRGTFNRFRPELHTDQRMFAMGVLCGLSSGMLGVAQSMEPGEAREAVWALRKEIDVAMSDRDGSAR